MYFLIDIHWRLVARLWWMMRDYGRFAHAILEAKAARHHWRDAFWWNVSRFLFWLGSQDWNPWSTLKAWEWAELHRFECSQCGHECWLFPCNRVTGE